MKPINENERTWAFTQFLLLFIITVILLVFALFWDIKIDQNEKKILRAEIDSLKREKSYLRDLSSQIDSMYNSMNKMDETSALDFDNSQTRILSEIQKWSSPVSEDSTAIERIKLSISKALNTWAYDKRFVRNGKLETDINKEIREQKEALQIKYEALEERHNSYVSANPPK